MMHENEIKNAKNFLDTINSRTESFIIMKVDGDGMVHICSSGSVEKFTLQSFVLNNFISDILSGRVTRDESGQMKRTSP